MTKRNAERGFNFVDPDALGGRFIRSLG